MITAKIHGMRQLQAKLYRLQAEVPSLLRQSLMKAAEPIRDEAQLRAPVSEGAGGHLAAGIKIRPVKHASPGRVEVRVGVKEKLWYGVFPEYGTSKMAARPFMRPAFDARKAEALRILKDELKRGLT